MSISFEVVAQRPINLEELQWMSQEVCGYVEAVLNSLSTNVPKVSLVLQTMPYLSLQLCVRELKSVSVMVEQATRQLEMQKSIKKALSQVGLNERDDVPFMKPYHWRVTRGADIVRITLVLTDLKGFSFVFPLFLAGFSMKGGQTKADSMQTGNKLKSKGSGSGKRGKKAAKDPNKPKRPASAFFVFMEEFRRQYKEEHPDNKSVSAVGKAGVEKWKSMAEVYFVEAGAIAVRRVRKEDMHHVAKATGATMVSTFADMEGKGTFDSSLLGYAEEVVEERIADGYVVMIKGTKSTSAVSLILRGANDYMLDEMERALHDALSIVKRTLESNTVVAGGGAVEAALSFYLEYLATTLGSREQLAMQSLPNLY
ncbi:hypothetical protein REPUB_Repub18cG0175300 [Reevesia pubescens]